MCGICGWFNSNREIEPGVLVRMNQIVKHRGPDDEGYAFCSDDRCTSAVGEDSIDLPYKNISEMDMNDSFLALGHRRLSIIDLSRQGHQPMIAEDDEVCITFNGEIYNYIEVRKELESRGIKFHTNSDTEVLLKAYAFWGTDCVYHLNGMWGFAIWDRKRRRIFCSRDRLGAKPFYYYRDKDNFIFSSEIKQLLENPAVPHVLNEELLVTHIIWNITDFSEETLVRDIKTLPGGYNLIVDIVEEEGRVKIDKLSIEKYWDIKTGGVKDEKKIAEAFRFHEDAVRIRTRSDVPIGILLSGGLDSSTIVAEVAEHYLSTGQSPDKINTYTSCYEGFEEGDEREFASKVNSHCQTKQHFIYPDETDTFSVLKKMIWHSEGLASFNAMGSFLTVQEIQKTGIKVILNGQGADETMFGYERYYVWYLMDILKGQGFPAFFRELKQVSENSRLSIRELIQYIIYFNFVPVRKIRCRNRMKDFVTEYVLETFRKNKKVEKFLGFPDLAAMQYNEIRGTQLTHILRMDDRMFMAFSIESRVPFIDYRYVEAAVQIPENMKIKDGYTKYLQRKHIEGKLPEEVVWRKNKMGWPSPRKRWIERMDTEKVENLFCDARSAKFFDLKKIEKLYKEDPEAFAVEQFLNVELFMRLFDLKAV